MNIRKVLKKMKESEKKSDKSDDDINKKYPTSVLQKNKGFHTKANSYVGAARQRSIGNRNEKSG